MDSNEATAVVLSRIKSIDPQNATKIMGYLLLHDVDDKDLIRLAFVPQSVLHDYILKVKSIISRTSTAFPGPSTPPPSPFLVSVARSHPGSHHLMPTLLSPRFAQRSDFDMGKSPKNHSCSFPGNPMGPNSITSLPFGGSQRFQGGSVFNGDFTESFLNDTVSSMEEFHLRRRSCSDSDAFVGSAAEALGTEQMPRLKLAQNHRKPTSAAASQFLLGTPPSSYENYLNPHLQHQNDPQRMASMMMMAEDMYKYGRFQQERSDLLSMTMAEKSRQIYLTFPAESTFKDEDVATYFSKYGPVEDVRIPYQQKRMFGFVTFYSSETTSLVLDLRNPHHICNSRVLVKPYMVKEELLEKKQMHQQKLIERGPRNSSMLRRKLQQQADLQQTIEFQDRRLMNLQLTDQGNDSAYNNRSHQRAIHNSDFMNHDLLQECNGSPATSTALEVNAPSYMEHEGETFNSSGVDYKASMDHLLPNSPFSSPTKSYGENANEDPHNR